MWLFVDNYDSFSNILLDYLLQINSDIKIIQNDEYSLEAIISMNPNRIILSPGPKNPDEAGITLSLIDYFHNKIPILGVCLGHQALAQYFGAKVIKAPYPIHGKTSILSHHNKGIFENFAQSYPVMRYHSLVVSHWEDTGIVPWAYTEEDEQLMAFGHQLYPIVGLQFHPESVLTEHGLAILKAWDSYFKI